MQGERLFIGVDVSKASLEVAVHGAVGGQRVRNEEDCIRRWLAELPASAALAMESTGRYHVRLAEMVHASGRPVYVLNARDVSFYAKALGARGKTDRVDARIIARYLAEHQSRLHRWVPGSAAQREVQQLLQRRARIVKYRVAVRQTLQGLEALQPALQAMESPFEQALQRIDEQVQALLASEPQMQRGYTLLRTVTGLGASSAALLTALLSRIPFTKADALVAYSGLDPRANDSGAKTGRRRLSKRGNAELRRHLFLAAFAAARSKVFGPTYQALRGRGFQSTEAVSILARKLLRVAWAVWRSGQPFDPARLARENACAKP
jgi:transposase